jgi:hypothetical protein
MQCRFHSLSLKSHFKQPSPQLLIMVFGLAKFPLHLPMFAEQNRLCIQELGTHNNHEMRKAMETLRHDPYLL